MSEKDPFSIDVQSLRKRPKDTTTAAVAKADQVGEQHGFVDRSPKGRRGRQPSPRTGQVHAKVLPDIADEIAAEATRRGVTQGIIIEEAWTLYLQNKTSD
jgi:hypothetical protein